MYYQNAGACRDPYRIITYPITAKITNTKAVAIIVVFDMFTPASMIFGYRAVCKGVHARQGAMLDKRTAPCARF